jgi:hypothetical protein
MILFPICMIHTTEIKFDVLSEHDIHATPIASNSPCAPYIKMDGYISVRSSAWWQLFAYIYK